MLKKLDDSAYSEGQRAFKRGASLRSMMEPILSSALDPKRMTLSHEENTALDNAMASRMLGFADGFLEMMRSKR